MQWADGDSVDTEEECFESGEILCRPLKDKSLDMHYCVGAFGVTHGVLQLASQEDTIGVRIQRGHLSSQQVHGRRYCKRKSTSLQVCMYGMNL